VTPLFREVMGNNDANKPLAERLYDVRKPDAGRLAVVAAELTEQVHRLDDSRPVTSAMTQTNTTINRAIAHGRRAFRFLSMVFSCLFILSRTVYLERSVLFPTSGKQSPFRLISLVYHTETNYN
jgi:hypothetical protein